MICKRKRRRMYPFPLLVYGAFWIGLVLLWLTCCYQVQAVLSWPAQWPPRPEDAGAFAGVHSDAAQMEQDEWRYQRDIEDTNIAYHFAQFHRQATHRVRKPLLQERILPHATNSSLKDVVPPKLETIQSKESVITRSQAVNTRDKSNLVDINNKSMKNHNQVEYYDRSSKYDSLNSSMQQTRMHHNISSTLLHKSPSGIIKTPLTDRGGAVEGQGHNVTAERSTMSDKAVSNSKPQRRLPGALIIGVKKAGTRALLEYLRMHPLVEAPGPEPHFFDKNYHLGLEWYRRQMPLSVKGQLTMEKTPSYFITKEAPRRIRDLSRDMRLLVVVRDPVTRAISDYVQAQLRRPELPPFEQMAFLDSGHDRVNSSWGGIRIGIYVRYLEKWLKYFPQKQILFVDGERLINQPGVEIKKVQHFLRLPSVINETHFKFNNTKGFPCLLKPKDSGRAHCLGSTKGRAHPDVSARDRRTLQRFFAPFNAQLFAYIGETFDWYT